MEKIHNRLKLLLLLNLIKILIDNRSFFPLVHAARVVRGMKLTECKNSVGNEEKKWIFKCQEFSISVNSWTHFHSNWLAWFELINVAIAIFSLSLHLPFIERDYKKWTFGWKFSSLSLQKCEKINTPTLFSVSCSLCIFSIGYCLGQYTLLSLTTEYM